MDPIYLMIVAVVSIAVLLFLVMKLKWPAYLALLAVAVLTALVGGIPVQEVIPTVIAGMGGTLGSVALLVGLGAMLGGIIEKTGGAELIATKAAKVLGKKRLGPALLIASAIVAIPIFFDVAFIILVPIIFSFAKAAGHKSPIFLGAPVAVLMVFIHNAVPPHPGIVGSTTLLNPDVMGLVTILGLLLAVPMAFVIWFVNKRLEPAGGWVMSPEIAEKYADAGAADFDEVERHHPEEHGGTLTGSGSQDMSDIMDSALAPAAIVVFVTGAGGVFARVLTESGIGDAVSGMMVDLGVPIVLLAFLLALIFKVAQGSGTVATLTAAGLVQSTVASGGYSEFQVALIILAIAMGSVSLSHINDSGFWIATKFLGLSVGGGLKTWTLMCTIVGFLGIIIISIAWFITAALV